MRSRFYWSVILLAVVAASGCDLLRAGVTSSFTVERAKVEQVLQAEANGYRFVAYVVTWNAVQVVVSDPLAKSQHRTGDEISFMAQRMGLPGKVKTLNFTLAEP